MELPKILIVDDREFDRILYREYLGELSYSYCELDDGETIVETAINFNPNLIILDWQMPLVGGLDSLKLLKKNHATKDIPVIIITGLEDEKVLEEAFDFGSIDFINKPVSRIELSSRVFNTLRLNEAMDTVYRQKTELTQLNEIIRKQNQELQKSLNNKTEQFDKNTKAFQQTIDQSNRKLMGREIDSTKLVNEIKNLKSMIHNCQIELRQENNESRILRKLQMVERAIGQLNVEDDTLNDFKKTLQSVEPDFYKKLAQINPNLTPNELKNCAFIKMNLDNYEVSRILNVELKSLQMTRYRLKKKLNLEKETSLREFILSV